MVMHVAQLMLYITLKLILHTNNSKTGQARSFLPNQARQDNKMADSYMTTTEMTYVFFSQNLIIRIIGFQTPFGNTNRYMEVTSPPELFFFDTSHSIIQAKFIFLKFNSKEVS